MTMYRIGSIAMFAIGLRMTIQSHNLDPWVAIISTTVAGLGVVMIARAYARETDR